MRHPVVTTGRRSVQGVGLWPGGPISCP